MYQLSRTQFYIRTFLFAIYLINGLILISSNYITNDEMDHWSYGKRVLMNRPEKIYPFDDASAMPVSGLNAIPRAVQQLLNPELRKTDSGYSDIMNGRYVTLLVSLLIGMLIYSWSKDLFGEKGALFSLFLFVFCPNINANTAILTTDAYTALATLATAYYFYRFIIYSGWKNFVLFSFCLAIAQVTKQSLFLLIPFFAVLSVIVLMKRGSFFSRARINLIRLAVLGITALIVINVAFLFRGTGMSLSEYRFSSDYFRGLQESRFSGLPLPLPSPFVEGFDLVKYMLSIGSGNEQVSGRSYLFGKYFTGSVWYYYPAIIIFKTPLSVLAFLLASIIITVRKLARGEDFFRSAYPLSLAFFFIIFFSFFNTSQHGIRHLLMIYPLIYVVLGEVVHWRLFRGRYRLVIPVIYGLATFYYFFPNLLSYTNELIPVKKNAYRILASSNIDYGQCNDCYERYIKANPGVKQPGEGPEAGTFLIGINYYLDLEGKGKYAWLRKFEPVGHVNHCLLLIRVKQEDLNTVK